MSAKPEHPMIDLRIDYVAKLRRREITEHEAKFLANEIERLREEWKRSLERESELRAALAAADVLAHQFTYTEAHRRYWELRGGEGVCTVCIAREEAREDLTHRGSSSG